MFSQPVPIRYGIASDNEPGGIHKTPRAYRISRLTTVTVIHIWLRIIGRLIYFELERILEGGDRGLVWVVSWHLLGRAEETHDINLKGWSFSSP